MGRAAFLISILERYLQGQRKNCPYCYSDNTNLLARKKIVLELRKCEDCLLKYRYPKDNDFINWSFYQRRYKQGLTSEVPSRNRLGELLGTNFADSELDFSKKISIGRQYKKSGRLLDYGCSWGYGVYQFKAAGYKAIGFEISKPRAEYGKSHLDVEILDTFDELEALQSNSFDIIFANHVLEHLPSPRSAFINFKRLLNTQGILMIFVPNSGGTSARNLGVNWGQLIGEKHALALDVEFFSRQLPLYGFRIKFSSSPYNVPIIAYESAKTEDLNLLGDELLVIGTKI